MANDVQVELFYSGAWHDITGDVRQSEPIVSSWGTSDEATKPAPLSLQLILDNTGGTYTARNPRSPLYGLIGRNTPVRVRLGDKDAALELQGDEASFASTPDAVALDLVGDIDVRLEIEPASWRPAEITGLVRKYAVETGANRSWALLLTPAGRLDFVWTTDGTFATASEIVSTASIPAAAGRLVVRVTLDVDNGAAGNTVTFYTGPAMAGPWTQLGSPVVRAGVTSIRSSTAPLEVGRTRSPEQGGFISAAFDGRVYAFQLRNGINGVIRANPDFTLQDVSTTSFFDSAGRPWTVRAPAAVIGDRSIRAAGEISSWPTTWDLSGANVAAPIQAAGILRRLGQGAKPLRSSLYRDLSTKPAVVAYWPLEDGAGAVSFAAGRAGDRSVLLPAGEVKPAASSLFVASDPLPTIGYGLIGGWVPRYAGAADQRLIVLVAVPEDGVEPDGVADRILIVGRTFGATSEWQVRINELGQLKLTGKDSDGVTQFDSTFGASPFAVNGKLLMVSLWLRQSGGNVQWELATWEVGGDDTWIAGTHATTFGRFVNVRVGAQAGESGAGGTAFGHVAVLNDDVTAIWDSLNRSLIGWAGETALARITRLCAEENVPLRTLGTISQPVGPQRGTFLDVLADAALVDLGTIGDDRDAVRLFYRTGRSLENQPPALVLDYAAGEVAPDLEPVDDDQATRNDVTVQRPDGSSAQAMLEDGALSIAAVGRYDVEVEVNVADDAQLHDQAGWRLHLGTIDEARYPNITADLTAAPDLTAAAAAVFVGDRVQVTNPPAWLPPATIDQLALGGQETLTPYRHLITWNTAPASAWDVGSIGDDELGRVDTDGSVTGANFNAGTATALTVQVVRGPRWTTDPAEFPFMITAGGVDLVVTGIAGTGTTQTFTVQATPANGISKIIPAGSDVRLTHPMITGI